METGELLKIGSDAWKDEFLNDYYNLKSNTCLDIECNEKFENPEALAFHMIRHHFCRERCPVGLCGDILSMDPNQIARSHLHIGKHCGADIIKLLDAVHGENTDDNDTDYENDDDNKEEYCLRCNMMRPLESFQVGENGTIYLSCDVCRATKRLKRNLDGIPSHLIGRLKA